MPWIIDYHAVVEQMRGQRFKSLYYHSGAFGFADDSGTSVVGWTTGADPTIRESARASVVTVNPPTVDSLVTLLTKIWREHLPGRVWLMPASHWAFELEYGSADWLPAVLENVGVDPGLLVGRNNASAIEFAPNESAAFAHVTARLLEMLASSDFTIAFPGRQVVCMVHHHKQLWWTTTVTDLATTLRQAAEPAPPMSDSAG